MMKGDETDEIIEELFESLLQSYQKNLEEPIRGTNFVPCSIDLLYCSLQKVDLERSRSYIYSLEWLENKKTTINPQNNDDNCFQYALTVALNHQHIGNNPQRIPKIKPFIDQHNWNEIDFPSLSKDWKNFEQNKKAIALNILFVP